MKANRKVMLGAALLVAVVAFAAIGYATVYKSTTDNTGNNLSVTYVELSQDGTAKYAAAVQFIDGIFFDTVVDAEGTDFTIAEDTPTVTIGSTPAYKISNGNLQLKLEDNLTASNSYKITITSDKGLIDGLTYYFGLQSGTSTPIWSSGVTDMTAGCILASVPEGTYTVLVAVTGTPSADPETIETIKFTFVAESITA